MANILPGAVWQPVDVSGRAARRKGRGLVGHVAVSNSANLAPGGSASGRNADWHFYLPKDGPAIQYIDMDLQCWASGAGNASLVAFESQGGLGSSAQLNAEPWTDNQLNWAARILRYLHDTEGVPLQVMPDSLPGSQGFGTHRLGISPWRVSGGEVWSSSNGKECPGDTKHAQRDEVVRRAISGATSGDPFMALTDAQQVALATSVGKIEYIVMSLIKPSTDQVPALIAAIKDLTAAVGKIQSGGAVNVQAVADQLTVVPKP